MGTSVRRLDETYRHGQPVSAISTALERGGGHAHLTTQRDDVLQLSKARNIAAVGLSQCRGLLLPALGRLINALDFRFERSHCLFFVLRRG